MKFREIVPNISTMLDKKRIASQYVIDYKNLDDKALDAALIKTAPQYYNEENVRIALNKLLFDFDRNTRILHLIILKTILLNQDDFLMPQNELDQAVIDIEQEIVNASNEKLQFKSKEKNRNIELFQYVLETAWDRNDTISPDEKNLIEKLRLRLKVTDREYQILEAKLARFPKDRNEIHLRDEIKKCRLELQSSGLILCFRSPDRVDFDIIPEEIAETLRAIWGIELKNHGYRVCINYKSVRNKKYLMDILEKADVYYDKNSNIGELQDLVINHVRPSTLLGGFSPQDGLNAANLSKWCKELSISSSGQKSDLIQRIIEYYDELKEMTSLTGPDVDERELLFSFFGQLAGRELDELRRQGIIAKDLECEKAFEKATYYVFERYLGHKPLQLSGTEHADGILAFKDKLILWDNKSKESPVNLKDHIKQFDRYIQTSQKSVAAFIVIGPEFTEESNKEAMKYKVANDVPIALLRAPDLKDAAVQFAKKANEEPFPLGNLTQAGIVDTANFVY